MPPAPCAQAAREGTELASELAEAIKHAGLLALVFERLPAGDQCFTVSRLSRQWRRWAAPRAPTLREQQCPTSCEYGYLHLDRRLSSFAIPLWFLREASPQLRAAQRDAAARRAAWHGDVAALECLVEAGGRVGNKPAVLDTAARGGHLEVLQWARQQGWRLDWGTCSTAAGGGHLEMLQWARQHGCPWSEWTCSGAARRGHLEVLQWARQHGCPWDEKTCSEAARGGHLGVLQWARQHGCPWDEKTCFEAAAGGHLEVLQWARQHGCPWDAYTCMEAARHGHLEVLRWARQHGCLWNEWTCTEAAGNGHLEVLQWARQHGCPWNEWTCNEAACRGHLEVLQWARRHGCPWDRGLIEAFVVLDGIAAVADWLQSLPAGT